MPLYAAHAPKAQPSIEAAYKVALVRQGFSRPAFLFGLWWLASKRLWRAFFVFLAVILLVFAAPLVLGLTPAIIPLLMTLLHLYLGVEAAGIESAALERSGLPLADMVAASDPDVALQVFFARWMEKDAAPAAPPRPAAPPSAARAPEAGFGAGGVLGLFPQTGGRA